MIQCFMINLFYLTDAYIYPLKIKSLKVGIFHHGKLEKLMYNKFLLNSYIFL